MQNVPMSDPSAHPEGDEAPKLPTPSAELIALRLLTEAYLLRQRPKDRKEFIKVASDLFEAEEALAETLRIRPPAQAVTLARARREAAEWWRRTVVSMMARL